MPDSRVLVVPPECEGQRLDAFVARALPDVSRTAVARWIEDGRVTLPDRAGPRARPPRAGVALRTGESVVIDVPADRAPAPHLEPETVPLDIVYEDSYLLVVNKPAGMTVHPGAGRTRGTLVHALMGYTAALSPGSSPERPGIVHRLDKDTSGLLVVARTEAVHRQLAAALAARHVHRTYRALVWGSPQPAADRIDGAIGRDPRHRQRMAVVATGGKPAITHYRTLARGPLASLLQLDLDTGRTHQIRVHCATKGWPLVGDPTYGGRERAVARQPRARLGAAQALLAAMPRQALHAWRLAFPHPVTGTPVVCEAPEPDDFRAACGVAALVPLGGGA